MYLGSDKIESVGYRQESMPSINTKKLWLECFKQALSDIESVNDDYRNDAIKWFKNASNDSVGSFVWVCNLFGLDIKNTRNVVLKGVLKC